MQGCYFLLYTDSYCMTTLAQRCFVFKMIMTVSSSVIQTYYLSAYSGPPPCIMCFNICVYTGGNAVYLFSIFLFHNTVHIILYRI